MKKVPLLLLFALIVRSSAVALGSVPARTNFARQLKKQDKAQRKDLKQRERAMKKFMDQHELSHDQRKRFKNDIKMQERLLHKSQKDDSRRLKQAPKVAKPAAQAL